MRFDLISLLELQQSLLLGFPKPEKTILLLQNCQASQRHFILCPSKLLPCSSIEFPVTSSGSNVNSGASYLATLVTFPPDLQFPFVQPNRDWWHRFAWFRCCCPVAQLGEQHNSKKSASVGAESGPWQVWWAWYTGRLTVGPLERADCGHTTAGPRGPALLQRSCCPAWVLPQSLSSLPMPTLWLLVSYDNM